MYNVESSDCSVYFLRQQRRHMTTEGGTFSEMGVEAREGEGGISGRGSPQFPFSIFRFFSLRRTLFKNTTFIHPCRCRCALHSQQVLVVIIHTGGAVKGAYTGSKEVASQVNPG